MTSLDGPLRLTLDLFDEGLRQKWYGEDDLPPSQWPTPRDYEIKAGEIGSVPSFWKVLKPKWTHFEGAAWCTRERYWTLRTEGERIILQIDGASYSLLAFLDGAHVGGHCGGSTPCSLQLTKVLRRRRNRLQIMVHDRRRPDRVRMHHFDCFNHWGPLGAAAAGSSPRLRRTPSRADAPADPAVVRRHE